MIYRDFARLAQCYALDEGGELDPYGADLQGNPLGGVVYSNGTSDSTNASGTLTQAHNWNRQFSLLFFKQ
jgi:hypothetical protein